MASLSTACSAVWNSCNIKYNEFLYKVEYCAIEFELKIEYNVKFYRNN